MSFNEWKEAHTPTTAKRVCCPGCLHPFATRRKGYHFTAQQATVEISCPVCRKTYIQPAKEKGS